MWSLVWAIGTASPASASVVYGDFDCDAEEDVAIGHFDADGEVSVDVVSLREADLTDVDDDVKLEIADANGDKCDDLVVVFVDDGKEVRYALDPAELSLKEPLPGTYGFDEDGAARQIRYVPPVLPGQRAVSCCRTETVLVPCPFLNGNVYDLCEMTVCTLWGECWPA